MVPQGLSIVWHHITSRMVKLQKRFAYTYKNKEHYKHLVNIPEDALEKLGWNNVEELELIVRNKELVIHPKNKKKDKT